MALDDCRRFYAQETRFAAGLISPALIEAYAQVPREKYLGPPPWWIASADARALSGTMSLAYISTGEPPDLYHNGVVAIDRAKDINNGQPSALAWWIKALDRNPRATEFVTSAAVSVITLPLWQKWLDRMAGC
jgi:protein-L-isoaspartate(D-aspartate) O-methyltransferase